MYIYIYIYVCVCVCMCVCVCVESYKRLKCRLGLHSVPI